MAQRLTCRGGSDSAAACASLDAPVGAGDRRCRFDARCGGCCCGPDDGRPSCSRRSAQRCHCSLSRRRCAGQRQVAVSEQTNSADVRIWDALRGARQRCFLLPRDATFLYYTEILPATASASPAATSNRRPRRSPPPPKQPTASTAAACWRPSSAAPSEPRHRRHYQGVEAPPRPLTLCCWCCRAATGRVCCRQQARLLP